MTNPMMDILAELPADPIVGLQPKLLRPSESALAVPLLGALPSPADGPDFHSFISGWSCNPESEGQHRGIMTLRNANDVVVSLFFFALRTESALNRLLHVSRLRAADATGRHATLAATLHTIATLGERMGCHEALLEAEKAGQAWYEMASALMHIGPAHGFEPRGHDWWRPLAPA